MSALSFLKKREIGSKWRSSSLNFDHVISRLVCQRKDVFTIHGEETEVPPFACKFRRDAQSDLLAVCNEDGGILLYDTSRRYEDPLIKTFLAHHNAIFDICWVPDKYHLISGSGDHFAILWDMSHCKHISVFRQHTASIKSVDVCREQSVVFATGSRDGNINVWDTRVQASSSGFMKPVITICQAHIRKNTGFRGKKSLKKDPISSVSAVAFQNSMYLASAGVADGVIKVWDLRRTYVTNLKYLPVPKYQMNYTDSESSGHGCTCLVFDSQYKKLYACSTSHKILKFDCHSYRKEAAIYEGFQCSTYFVKLDLSSDDQYLLCGSSDEHAYIWKTSKPGLPMVQLSSHSAEVTSVCWSPYDITKLATCGDDFKVNVWKVADTETVSINENVHAIAEPYCGSPKNDSSSSLQDIVPSSTIVSRVPVKKSPVQSTQTPSKPAVRVITSFFSPLTPSPVQTVSTQNQATLNESSSPSPNSKLLNNNIPVDGSSQILTPCNHVNKTSLLHQSSNDSSEAKTNPEQNFSPEQKSTGVSFLKSSSSVQNKENASTDHNAETAFKTNICQGKRKVLRHSTPIVKRRRTVGGKRSQGVVNRDNKTTTGKTIMNYFTVEMCSDTK